MITEEDSRFTYDYGNHYIIYPHFDWWDVEKHFKKGGKLVEAGFQYASDNNKQWLYEEEMREMLKSVDIVY